MDTKELIGKALWPTALVVVAAIVGGAMHGVSRDAVTASQNVITASNNAVTATENIRSAAKTVSDTAKAVPQIAKDASHEAGEGAVKGVANGTVQVGGAIALAPVVAPVLILTPVLSAPDRENVERVLNPTKWKIF